MEEENKKKYEFLEELYKRYHDTETDLGGSYTGTASGDDPTPEQDADDL